MRRDLMNHLRRMPGRAPTATAAAAGPVGHEAGPWAWARVTIDRAFAALAALGGHGREDDVLHAFADVIEEARDPAEVRVALIRLAHEISGASRVELERAVDGRAARVASWPPSSPADADEAAGHDRAGRRPAHRAEPAHGLAVPGPAPEAANRWVRLPCRAAGRDLGVLKLRDPSARDWSPWMARRLASLAAMASAAELALLAAGAGAGPGDDHADPAGLQPPGFLDAFLPYALAQARRRREPLTLFHIGLDRMAAIRDLFGPGLAAEARRRVGLAVVSALRSSDVVARLDGDRLAAVLPAASADNAMMVAEAVRAAVARVGTPTPGMPLLTASIGVATFPDHAHDAECLRAAASSALAHAREIGRPALADGAADGAGVAARA